MDLKEINRYLKGGDPGNTVKWALENARKPVITTNFRPYESAILHLVTTIDPDIDVIWCDTGYNTPDTYRHAKMLIDGLKLNIHIYVPQQTVGFRNVTLGIPEIDTPEHEIFTRQVKLEPFQRAMKEFEPDVWFTNLRKGQTALRDHLDIVSIGKNDVLKVSPFYYFSDENLDDYLNKYRLPNEKRYYDPTKVLKDRECGLHKLN